MGGSMQKIHTIRNKRGKLINKGRKIMIDAVNKLVKELQDKENGLAGNTQADAQTDVPISIASFNTEAKIQNFDSILDVPKFNAARYNPGGQTNLNDALGCAISYFREKRHKGVKVYVISDGVHNIEDSSYSNEDVGAIVNKLRN